MLEWLKSKSKGNGEKSEPIDMLGETLLVSSSGVYVLDLRDLTQFRQGHIKGSHLIPYAELTQRTHELPHDRLIVTVDATDRRGRQAAKLLRKEGYRASNLKGGINAWPGKLVK